MSQIDFTYLYIPRIYTSDTGYTWRGWTPANFRVKRTISWLNFVIDGKNVWVSDVRATLYRYGVCCVWVCKKLATLPVFKKRLVDCHKQDWHCHVTEIPWFNVYTNFKSELQVEPY